MSMAFLKWLFWERSFGWYVLVIGGLIFGSLSLVLHQAVNIGFHISHQPTSGGLLSAVVAVLADELRISHLLNDVAGSFIIGCVTGFFTWLSVYTAKRHAR